ncbi:hypothetical protein PZA11_004760 [Diplocarpon coronariae]
MVRPDPRLLRALPAVQALAVRGAGVGAVLEQSHWEEAGQGDGEGGGGVYEGEGRAEWVKGGGGEGQGSVFWVWWRDVEEWAGLIGGWVDETAQKNTVLTLYELTESEATISQDFHGMDAEILQKALAVLVQRGKAQVFGQEDQQGVKFF